MGRGGKNGAVPVLKPESLPGILCIIAQISGVEAAVRFARVHGGRTLYLPQAQNIGAGHALVDFIGVEAAARVVDMVGSGPVSVPNAKTILTW